LCDTGYILNEPTTSVYNGLFFKKSEVAQEDRLTPDIETDMFFRNVGSRLPFYVA